MLDFLSRIEDVHLPTLVILGKKLGKMMHGADQSSPVNVVVPRTKPFQKIP